MRVLLAVDGSAASDSARELVGSLAWPDGTVIEVVAAVEPVVDFIGTTVMPMPTSSPELEFEAAHELAQSIATAAAGLEAPGRTVTRALLHGRPATMIVEEAGTFRADLVVVGSRGLGPLTSMLLGSVSAEVIDHAPCPVLVVRRPTIGSVLVAVDGSTSAQAAVTFLGESRFLDGHHIEVLSVATSAAPIPPVHLAGPHGPDVEPGPVRIDEHREWAESLASSTAATLGQHGLPGRASISQGDPAHEIIEAAKAFGCALIVLGSRGLTGVSRLLLGSVARNVVLHSHASVLVVHVPHPVRTGETAKGTTKRPAERPTDTSVKTR
jgi:nucleotide-binding universal stress UspA family protein